MSDPMTRRRTGLLAAALAVCLAAAVMAPPAGAQSAEPGFFQEAVTVQGVRDHQRAFQRFAAASNNTRALGTPGYGASAKYVADKARAAGLDVTVQPFTARLFQELAAALLQQVAPNQVTYENAATSQDPITADFLIQEYSGSGDVTARVVPVDVALAPNTAVDADSGCSTDDDLVTPENDFRNFPRGSIALIQRGTCTFAEKAENAEQAGAAGVIIFNQGNDPSRIDVFGGTLGDTSRIAIPVVGSSYPIGANFVRLSGQGLRLRLFTSTRVTPRRTVNVLAETRTGRPDNVVMLGAHLDSVPEGPGINDNGSGSGAILEVAEQITRYNLTNKVRFAWWGAEEEGLVGSNYYVANLSEQQLGNIALYLNFDMVGSPNFVRFIYDGDGDEFDIPGPDGSDAIENFFERHFNSQGFANNATAFDGRSDYFAFITAGVPSGGLFTGAEGVKTPEQARIYGGRAGAAYDPCYHQACDGLDNVSLPALSQMSDAIAHAAITYAYDTSAIGGGARARAATAGGRSMDYQGNHLVR